jgi:hypothetical protein
VRHPQLQANPGRVIAPSRHRSGWSHSTRPGWQQSAPAQLGGGALAATWRFPGRLKGITADPLSYFRSGSDQPARGPD